MIPFCEIYSQVFSLHFVMLLKFCNTFSHYCHYDTIIFIPLSLCVLFLVESTLKKQPLPSIFQVLFSSNHVVNFLNSSIQTQPSDTSENSLKISSSSVPQTENHLDLVIHSFLFQERSFNINPWTYTISKS